MRSKRILASAFALGTAALFLQPGGGVTAFGYSITNGALVLGQRDFRVFNNFTDTASNNNQTPDPNFPGYQGAVMAIWKGCIEWGSALHGDGNGDPHQPGGLGSGGANFDPTFQGLALDPGGGNDNIHSAIGPCAPGLLGFTVNPTANGWQIRYCNGAWTLDDGPGTFIGGNKDIQGTAAHEYGHALGLGHSSDPNATMASGAPSDAVSWRSIEADDIAGVQAIYGVASPSKPTITGISLNGAQLTITGTNFSPTNNGVWFTQEAAGGTGLPVRVLGVVSDGTSIHVTVPAEAGPGDVLVRNNSGGTHSSLSNAWPIDPPDPPACPPPLSYGAGEVGSTGNLAVIGSSGGDPSVSNPNFAITLTGGKPTSASLLLQGPGPAATPVSWGTIWVAAPFVRIPGLTDASGNDSYTVPMTPGMAGNKLWYMWIVRDAGFGGGAQHSDGLEVTFCP